MAKDKVLIITFPFRLTVQAVENLKSSLKKLSEEAGMVIVFLEDDKAPGYQFFYAGIPDLTMTQEELQSMVNPVKQI